MKKNRMEIVSERTRQMSADPWTSSHLNILLRLILYLVCDYRDPVGPDYGILASGNDPICLQI